MLIVEEAPSKTPIAGGGQGGGEKRNGAFND
jgi:hypothetical protein